MYSFRVFVLLSAFLVTSTADSPFDAVGNWAQNTWQSGSNVVSNVGQQVGHELSSAANSTGDKFSQVVSENVASNLGNAAQQIRHDLTGIANNVKDQMQETQLGQDLNGAVRDLRGKLSETANQVANSHVVENLHHAAQQIGKDLGGIAGDVNEKVQGAAGDIVDHMSDVIDDIQGKFFLLFFYSEALRNRKKHAQAFSPLAVTKKRVLNASSH